MTSTLFRKLFFNYLLIAVTILLFFLLSENLNPVLRTVMALLLVFLLPYFLSGRTVDLLKRRLRRVNKFVGCIGKGDYDQSFVTEENDELAETERSVSELALLLKTQKELLREEEGWQTAVLESMNEGVLVLDQASTVIRANEKAKEFLGNELLGYPLTEKIRDPSFFTFLDQCKQGKKPDGFEIDLRDPVPIPLAVNLSPFLKEEKLSGVVVVLYNISWLKKLENMRKDFIANVSHELKTPLTSIKGFSETLIDDGFKDEATTLSFLKIINTNSDRMARIVDDLLVLSNIELGKVDYDIESSLVNELVEMIFVTLTQKAEKKGVVLQNELTTPLRVMADKNRLHQILINVIDNALKFTETGSVTVHAQQENDMIRISVKDTGVGIPEDKISRIGERFYRVDPARSRALGGTGLGLAIVKHIVLSMQGEFLITSALGTGTEVSFTLPMGK